MPIVVKPTDTHLAITRDLSSNQLSGTIPSTIGSLTNLQELYFPTNQLSGTIPSSIISLTNLYSLYEADFHVSCSA